MDKLTPADGASPDIVAGNIEKLREIFPEVFADGSVDFDALKQTLGSYVVLGRKKSFINYIKMIY
jgi:adenine-specific DNA-methyltransferase